MLKKTFFLATCMVLSGHTLYAHFTLDATPYRSDALNWRQTYLCDTHNNLLISQQDLMLVANLCYLSFMRSYQTLTAQDIALQAITAVWCGWQNIAQTRLDPSTAAPYAISANARATTSDVFWKAHDSHRAAGLTYARAVETIVRNKGLTTINAANGVSDLRSRSRIVMAQSLLDMRTYLSSIFTPDQTKGVATDLWKGFCFIKHLACYASQLALSSFSSADELNNTVGATGWDAISAVQMVGAQTWRTIEQARASFYLAHYEAISEVLQQLNVRAPLMFDTTGKLPDKKQTKNLPVHLLLNK